MSNAGILQTKLLLDSTGFTSGLNKAHKEMGNFYEKAGKGASNAERSFNSFSSNAEKSLKRLTSTARDARTEIQKMEGLSASLGGLVGIGAGAYVGVQFVGALRDSVDYYTKITGILKNATDSQVQYYQALNNTKIIAADTQTDLQAVSMFYARVTNSIKEYGMTQKEANMITATVSNALKAMGASTYEASSAMLQLSQGMQSGKLGGEEFRAAMESAPILMKQLAKSMGVAFKDLKDLSAAGELTIDKLTKAWTDPEFMKAMQDQAKQMHTITGALTNMRNETQMMLGELMSDTGGSNATIGLINGITESIKFLIANMDSLVAATLAYAAVKSGQFVAASVASVQATMRENAVTKDHIIAIAEDAAFEQKLAISKTQDIIVSEKLAAANLANTEALRRKTIQQKFDLEAEIASIKSKGAMQSSTVSLAAATEQLAVVNKLLAKTTTDVAAAQVASKAASDALTAARVREASAAKALEVANIDMINNTKKGFAGAASTIGSIVGRAGLIGMGLWMAYEIADYTGVIDTVFKSAEDRAKDAAKRIAGEVAKLDQQQTKTLYDARKRQYEAAQLDYNIRAGLPIGRKLTDSEKEMQKQGFSLSTGTRASNDAKLANMRNELAALSESLTQKESSIQAKVFQFSDSYIKDSLTKEEQKREKILQLEKEFNAEYQKLRDDDVSSEETRLKNINKLYDVFAKRKSKIEEEFSGGRKSGGSSRSGMTDAQREYKQNYESAQRAFEGFISKDDKNDMLEGEQLLYDMAEHMAYLNEEQKNRLYLTAQQLELDAILKETTEAAQKNEEEGLKRINEHLAVKQELARKEQEMIDKADKIKYGEDALERQKKWAEYVELVEGGYVSMSDAASDFIKKYGEDISKVTSFNDELFGEMEKSLANWLTNFDGGLKGLAQSFADIFRKMAAEKSAKMIFDWMLGGSGGDSSGSGGGSDLGGMISAGMSWLKGLSFDGGGFTGYGSRSGGLDGKGGFMAMLHPNETVVDHTKGQKSGGNVVNNITININGQAADKRTAMQVGREVQSALSRAAIRNG